MSTGAGPSTERVYGGRYELRRGIARGGMADVFLAHDRLLDRPVAVKVLFPELSSDRSFVERFRREAQAAANLTHPNIVSVYDWGEEGETYFIVMEYVEGRPLSEVIRSEGPLLADRAADIAADIAAALGSAHVKGVIHRDVKPSNVLLSPSGHVKVADFGIARAVSATEGLTQTGAVMGTATYFSPEQAQGHTVDARSDVYSLGIVLYEMLTGKPPFTADSPVSVAYKHVREDAPPPSEHNPDVPADLERITLKALAKNPANRYQSAADLRTDLQRFRAGQPVAAEPILAPPPPPVDATVAQTAYRDATQALPTAAVPAAATPPPRNRSGTYMALLVVLLLLLAGAVFLLAQVLGGDNGAPGDVTVPNVLGLTEAEARGALTEAGLDVKVERKANATAPQGQVFAQDPKPGDIIQEGDAVTIRVSKGEALVAVPSLVGLSIEDARAELDAVGLAIDEVPTPSDSVPKDDVIAQSPLPGEQVPKDTTVRVDVSTGAEKIPIPDVSGLTASEAANRLGQAGFVTREDQQPSDSVPAGRVIGTDPSAGTQVAAGSTVTILVSSGPDETTVPSVVGMTESQARQTLESADFVVNVAEQTTDDPTQNGVVIDQDPDGGTTAPTGSTVTIFVGQFAG